MRPFLLLASLLALVTFPVYGNVSDCYFGVTQDEDVDVEEDWGTCSDTVLTDCKGATCAGDNAVCFKVKYAGDDEGQVSFYGCVDDVDAPTDAGSRIPTYVSGEDTFMWSVEELKLNYLPPSDNCQRDQTIDDPPLLPSGFDELDGLFVGGDFCSCTDAGCNGAEGVRLTAGLVALTIMCAWLV